VRVNLPISKQQAEKLRKKYNTFNLSTIVVKMLTGEIKEKLKL
jgi:hypothetical protein